MNCLKGCKRSRFAWHTIPLCRMTTTSNDCGTGPSDASVDNIKLPEEPTTCCMSGCANCVWIEYANELNKLFGEGGQKTRDMVLSKITDPNMKAFLLMELKSLELSKSSKNS